MSGRAMGILRAAARSCALPAFLTFVAAGARADLAPGDYPVRPFLLCVPSAKTVLP